MDACVDVARHRSENGAKTGRKRAWTRVIMVFVTVLVIVTEEVMEMAMVMVGMCRSDGRGGVSGGGGGGQAATVKKQRRKQSL